MVYLTKLLYVTHGHVRIGVIGIIVMLAVLVKFAACYGGQRCAPIHDIWQYGREITRG